MQTPNPKTSNSPLISIKLKSYTKDMHIFKARYGVSVSR